MAIAAQIKAHYLTDVRLVVDYEDPRHRSSRPLSSAGLYPAFTDRLRFVLNVIKPPGTQATLSSSPQANFHEKAHFVKADGAATSWSSATTLCPSLCFHPHFW